MSRIILHVSVATIAFIAGLATNWSVNTFGGLAVEMIYHEATIPSLLPAKCEATPVDAEA